MSAFIVKKDFTRVGVKRAEIKITDDHMFEHFLSKEGFKRVSLKSLKWEQLARLVKVIEYATLTSGEFGLDYATKNELIEYITEYLKK